MFKLDIKESNAFFDKYGAPHFEAVLMPTEVRNNMHKKTLDIIFSVFHDQAAYDDIKEPLDSFKIRIDATTDIKSTDISGNTIEEFTTDITPDMVGSLGYPNYDDFWTHYNLTDDGLVPISVVGVYFLLGTTNVNYPDRFGKPLGVKWEYIPPSE